LEIEGTIRPEIILERTIDFIENVNPSLCCDGNRGWRQATTPSQASEVLSQEEILGHPLASGRGDVTTPPQLSCSTETGISVIEPLSECGIGSRSICATVPNDRKRKI
jgi:hypothetical protein